MLEKLNTNIWDLYVEREKEMKTRKDYKIYFMHPELKQEIIIAIIKGKPEALKTLSKKKKDYPDVHLLLGEFK